jgi:putative ABC transport system permease protein
VVGDVRPRGLELEVKPQIYLPYAQKPTPAPFVTFTVRTESAPLGLAGAVENEIRNLNKDLPVANVRAMEQIVAASLKQRRVTMLLLGVFAGIAVMLASVGIYGVIAYSVARRTHEIGIRMALGAQRRDVLRLVVGRGAGLVLAGVALGVAGALALTRVMSSLLYGVGAADPPTLAATALLLTAVSLLACYVPARRATKVDPLAALRYE